MEAKSYWSREMTPDNNFNPKEQIKRSRSGKQEAKHPINICHLFDFFKRNKII
jgi:hypothetical protein